MACRGSLIVILKGEVHTDDMWHVGALIVILKGEVHTDDMWHVGGRS